MKLKSVGLITKYDTPKPPINEHRLEQISLSIKDGNRVEVSAKLSGPPEESAWCRAWISDEDECYDEAASGELSTGSYYSLILHPRFSNAPLDPLMACMRIESAPLATEHVVRFILTPYLEDIQSGQG